jgi:hypothetical protein
MTNGVVERFEERAKAEHALYCLHPGGDGEDRLDKHASLQSHRDERVDRSGTIRWKIKPLEIMAGKGRTDLLFKVKLIEYGGRKSIANPTGERTVSAHCEEIEYGSKHLEGTRAPAGSFAEALDALWAPLAPSIRRVNDFGPYEWMSVQEKWACGHKGAMLAALKHEKVASLALLRDRARRAITHCAAQDEAYTWLKWRAQGARFHGAKQGRALGWLRVFAQKCLRNNYVRTEAQFFLKRLRAHVCGRRRQAARFLQQCGQHALMWQHDPGARSVFWFGWRDEQPAVIWLADGEHADEHQARIKLARKHIKHSEFEIHRLQQEKHELVEHQKRHPSDEAMEQAKAMAAAMEQHRLQIEEWKRQITVHEPLGHLDPRKEDEEPDKQFGSEVMDAAAPPVPPSSGRQLGFCRKGGARGGVGAVGAWQARGTGTEQLSSLGRCQREYFGGGGDTERKRVEAWLGEQTKVGQLGAEPEGAEPEEEAVAIVVAGPPKPTGLYECKFDTLPDPVEEKGVGRQEPVEEPKGAKEEEPREEASPVEPVDEVKLVTRETLPNELWDMAEAIYQKYNPEKLTDPTFMRSTFARNAGKEAALIVALKKKYEVPDDWDPTKDGAGGAKEQD